MIYGSRSRGHGRRSVATLFALLVFVAGACSSGSDSTSPDPSQSSDESGERQVLRFADEGTDLIAGLDPIVTTTVPDIGWIKEVYNGLVRFQPGNVAEIEPDLAESWDVSDDGLVWTFHLRDGVQFHRDFGELTADDVVFSLQRVASDESAWASDFAAVQSVEAVDDLTVVLTLDHPDAYLLQNLANTRGGFIVSQAAVEEYGGEHPLNPVGTGPFVLEEYSPGQGLRFVAHEDYFRGRPLIEEIDVRFVADENSRRLALENGEVDVIRGFPSQEWLDQVSGGFEHRMGSDGIRVLQFNMRVPPFDDVRVREALHHAYNWTDIAAFFGEDFVSEARSVLPSTFPEYPADDSELPSYEYDPDRARELLAEAGYPDGFSVDMLMSNNAVWLEPMEIIQSQFAAVGVDLNMQVVEHAAYREATDSGQNALGIIGPRRDNADAQMRVLYHSESEGKFNWSGYGIVAPGGIDRNGIDELLDQAATTLDDDERFALYEQAQIQVAEDLPLIPLYHQPAHPTVYDPQRMDFGYESVTPPPGSMIHIITEKSRILGG